MSSILTPALFLILWTLVIWVWMYATRLPAMRAAKLHPQKAVHPGALTSLPSEVRVVADNYNHLHEQPTLFYALVFYAQLAGAADGLTVAVAWIYVILRVAHSIVQIVVRNVTMRFYIFSLGTLCLAFLALRFLAALF